MGSEMCIRDSGKYEKKVARLLEKEESLKISEYYIQSRPKKIKEEKK